MPETFRIGMRNYLIMIAVCLGAATVTLVFWMYNRQISWMGIVIPIFIYFVMSLMLLITIGALSNRSEDKDAHESCEPILRRYKRTGNIDELLYGYELWRLESHGMATRISFLRAIIEMLVADGYVYEAADLLNDYQCVATTPATIKDYRRFRKVCERRMDAILAEATEQEHRWNQERRNEELLRERRRREMYQRDEMLGETR